MPLSRLGFNTGIAAAGTFATSFQVGNTIMISVLGSSPTTVAFHAATSLALAAVSAYAHGTIMPENQIRFKPDSPLGKKLVPQSKLFTSGAIPLVFGLTIYAALNMLTLPLGFGLHHSDQAKFFLGMSAVCAFTSAACATATSRLNQ